MSSQSIRSRRGVVIVYAMVFAITAAVTLYVASSIYQARIKASSMNEYALQQRILQWEGAHLLGASIQFGLDQGIGIPSTGSWRTYSTATKQYTTNSNWPSITKATLASGISGSVSLDRLADPSTVISNAIVSDGLLNLGGSGAIWQREGSLAVDTSASSSGFDTGAIFTIPGYDYRPTWASYPSLPASTSVSASASPNQEFVWLSSSGLPAAGLSAYFPFIEKSKGVCGDYNRGKVRWVQKSFSQTIAPVSSAFGIQNRTFHARALFVEEPITNYQLILVPVSSLLISGDSSSATASGLALSINGNVTLADGSSRAKALLIGKVYTSAFSLSSGEGAPIVAIAGEGQPQLRTLISSDRRNFDWRITPAWGRVSFGKYAGYDQAKELFSTFTPPSSSATLSERRYTVRGAQGVITPGLPSGSVVSLSSPYYYLNPTLYLSSTGALGLSCQDGDGKAANKALTCSTGSGVVDNWNSSATGSRLTDLNVTIDSEGAGVADLDDLISAVHTGGASGSTTVTVDLSKDISITPSTLSSADGSATNAPWRLPRDISLYNSGSVALNVVIQGNASTSAAAMEPLRILIKGASSVTFKPDPANAGVNLRRSLILCDSSPNIIFQDDAKWDSYGWYGVLISNTAISLRRTGGTGMRNITWRGTLMGVSSLNVSDLMSLTLQPDDGEDGNGHQDPAASYSLYNVFTPAYNSTLTADRPVPVVVPRLCWQIYR